MLSFLAVFNTEFCFSRLLQMAAIKKIIQPSLSIFSIFWASLFCFGFDLNQSQRTKPLSRNDYSPLTSTFPYVF